MRLESLYIRHFRGIKDLFLDLQQQNFVIDGPNGSGKSGIVDAIEYVFTGRINRLEGAGTGGLSVRTHGPHVDKRSSPRDSFVKAQVRLEDGRAVSVERGLDKPRDVKVSPESAEKDIRWIEQHPELALSRRELIKFILVEPGERSRQIQALLRLEGLDETRRQLTAAANTLARDHKTAEQSTASARAHFLLAAETEAMNSGEILSAANKRRQVLGLPALPELSAITKLSTGLGEGSSGSALTTVVNKSIAIRDAESLEEFLAGRCESKEVAALLEKIRQCEANTDLVLLVEQRNLIQSGLEQARAPFCPLCDEEWDLEKLKEHLKAKLNRANEAKEFSRSIVTTAEAVAGEVRSLHEHLELVAKYGDMLAKHEAAVMLRRWSESLVSFREKLRTVKEIIGLRDRLASDWTAEPEGIRDSLAEIREAIEELKPQSETDDARKYLLVCDERLDVYRANRLKDQRLQLQAAVAEQTKVHFDSAVEERLARLYQSVEQDLVRYYRLINNDDEEHFDAKLDPKKGKLTLEVDFYERGLFPPGAYHSEGHQDGMGLCLFLALIKRLLGERFTFVALDDILMSVDKGHRKQVCKLLKEEFPKTQFIITTHDEVWLHQMLSSKFVAKSAVKRFRGWTVEHGPLVDDYKEVWETIDEHLDKEEVTPAAGILRRHLEQVAGDLCERFRAHAPYRRDADHDLGELLPAATSKWRSLLKEAKTVSISWGKRQDLEAITTRESIFDNLLQATYVEQWAINKNVHYNEWATMTKSDFAPVVKAYRELLSALRCTTCDNWLFISPRKGKAEAIICDCKEVCINLNKKLAREAH